MPASYCLDCFQDKGLTFQFFVMSLLGSGPAWFSFTSSLLPSCCKLLGVLHLQFLRFPCSAGILQFLSRPTFPGKEKRGELVRSLAWQHLVKQEEEEAVKKEEKEEGEDEEEEGSDSSSDDPNPEPPCMHPDLLELVVDREKCRKIRRQYRQLIYTVQQNREDIVNTASDTLSEALEEANVLFDGVSRTREAALDAQFLVLASDLGKEKAKQLNTDMNFFNPIAFCDLLLLFVGFNWVEEECKEFSDCDDSIVLSFWGMLHEEATSWMLQAETFHFIFGSFKAERSARKPRLGCHKRACKMEGSGDMPTKLRRLDVHANQETTEKEVERILGLLQTYFQKYPDTPVSYFEFVIDPNSFSRTVENIFYVSFIIRDGFARIRLDQDRLPILEPTNVSQVDDESDSYSYCRKQGVISLSLQDWKNIVSTFEISEAMIKNSY